MTQVKFSFFSFLFLFTCFFFSQLVAEEIYNFPDLAPDLPLSSEFDDMIELVERDYLIMTNDDFYDLYSAAATISSLKEAIKDIYLRDYYSSKEDFLVMGAFEYNIKRKRLLINLRNELNSALAVTHDGKNLSLGLHFRKIDTHLSLSGYQNLTLKYGQSFDIVRKRAGTVDQYLNNNNFQGNGFFFNQGDMPSLISQGFTVDQNLNISLKGRVGQKVELEVNHNSKNRQNDYRVEYLGNNREFVSRIKFGDVNLNLGQKSHFVTTGGSSKEAFGILLEGEKDNFKFSGILSITKGISDVYRKTGGSRNIKDIDYMQNRFFELPDKDIIAVESSLYVQVRDENRTNGQLTLFQTTSSNTNVLLFELVDDSRYEIIYIDGQAKVHFKGSAFVSGYSLLFYRVKKNTAGSFVAGIASNVDVFLGANIYFNTNLIPIDGALGIAVLHIADNALSDGNLIHSYELRNHYSISSSVDLSSFEAKIVDQGGDLLDKNVWLGSREHTFERSGRVFLEQKSGYFYFEQKKPFANYLGYKSELQEGFYEVKSPTAVNHNLNISVNFDVEEVDFITLGRFNIIRNSVVVIRGGQVLSKSEYRVNYFNGKIYFNQKQKLLKGEVIEVHYEYQPFGSSLQKILIASRLDYTFRDNSYIGSTLAYTRGQDFTSAPEIGFEVGQQFVMDIDTHLELIGLFQRRRHTDYSLNFEGEWSFTLNDKNQNDLARIDDLENQISLSLPKSFVSYYLTANPYLDSTMVLGKSYFVDFSQYPLIGGRTTEEFTFDKERNMLRNIENSLLIKRQDVNFRDYRVRPGPFQVIGEGHLSSDAYPYQSSIVFDFDFALGADNSGVIAKKSYVSFIAPVGLTTSADFTEFNQIEIIYKLLPKYDFDTGEMLSDPKAIGLSFDVGQLSEDLDLDGTLDRENNEANVNGFEFNYVNNGYVNNTRIGSGHRGFNSSNEITIGNDILDEEDRNDDGIFIRGHEERVTTYPSEETLESIVTNFFYLFSQGYIDSESKLKNIINNGIRTNGATYENLGNASLYASDRYQKDPYYKVTIPLKTITDSQVQSVNYIRINLIELNNEINKHDQGRLVIESIKFKKDVWDRSTIDNHLANNPIYFSASTLSTLDDSDYNENHLARFFRKEYEDLHGAKLNNEFKNLVERAVVINYQLNGISNSGRKDDANGRLGIVEREDATIEGKDLSFYKAMKFYMFLREASNVENTDFIYRFGKDNLNYYELRIPMKNIVNNRAWKEYSIRFKASDSTKQNEFLAKTDSRHVFLLEFRERGNKNDTKILITPETEKPKEVDKNDYVIVAFGSPSLKNISYSALGVENKSTAKVSSGSFLVNEIAAIEDEVLFGHAYRMGFDFNKDRPIKYKNLNILSALRANVNYQYQGVDFSSIDLPANKGHDEVFTANGGFKLFDALSINGGYLKSYFISDFREDILPKDQQTLSIGENFNFYGSFILPRHLGVIAKIIPDISAAYNNNLRTSIELDQIDTNASLSSVDNREADIIQNVNLIQGYSVGLTKKYHFTKKIIFELSYHLETIFSRSDVLTNRKKLKDVVIIDESVKTSRYGFFMFSFDNHRDVNPILAEFHDPRESLLNKRDKVKQVIYDYDQDHEVKTSISLWDFKLGFDYGIDYSYHYRITNASQLETEIALRLNEDNFDNPWYYHTKAQYDSKLINYQLRFNYNSSIPLYLLRLNRFGISFSYYYQEDNFQYGVRRNINVSDLTKIDSVSLINASNVQNFFSEARDYRDINNRFSWSIDLPITFLNLGKSKSDKTAFFIDNISKFSLSRHVTYSEEGVLNENLPANLINGVAKNNVGIYGVDGKNQAGIIKTLQESYIAKSINLIFGDRVPYWKFPFIEDLIHWIATVIDKENYLKGWLFRDAYRIKIAQDLDAIVDYKKRGSINEDDRIAKIVAHDNYNTSAELIDRFDYALNFHRYYNFLSYIMPDSFDYSATLRTSKRLGELHQEEQINFNFRKDFRRLNDAITKILPKGKGFTRSFNLSSRYSYREHKNYSTKNINRDHTLNLGLTFIRLTKSVDLSINYNGSYSESYQAYRFYSEGDYFNNVPYLGIGDFSGKQVSSLYTGGDRHYLNFGQNERYYTIDTIEQLGTEQSDIIYFNHDIIFNFTFREQPPIVVKFGKKKFSLPKTKQQKLRILINFKNYLLPGVDASLFDQGQFSPSQQNNILGIKNLQNYENTSALNGDRQLWATKVSYENIFGVDKYNTFTITYGLAIAFVGVASAESYAGYLNERVLVDGEYQNKYDTAEAQFTRRTDYVQMGFDVFLTGSVRF